MHILLIECPEQRFPTVACSDWSVPAPSKVVQYFDGHSRECGCPGLRVKVKKEREVTCQQQCPCYLSYLANVWCPQSCVPGCVLGPRVSQGWEAPVLRELVARFLGITCADAVGDEVCSWTWVLSLNRTVCQAHYRIIPWAPGPPVGYAHWLVSFQVRKLRPGEVRDLSKVTQQVTSRRVGLYDLCPHLFYASVGVQVSLVQTSSPLEAELLPVAAGRKCHLSVDILEVDRMPVCRKIVHHPFCGIMQPIRKVWLRSLTLRRMYVMY